MNNVTQTNKKNINIRCPFGFANQLRLALAGCFLVQLKYVDTFNIEWSINNHNNVNFLDYFEPLPFITYNNISDNIPKEDIYETISFKRLIELYVKDVFKWEDALQISLKYLIPKPEIYKVVNCFLSTHNIHNAIGLHVRRTCKTALLCNESHRSISTLTNENILNVCSCYEKVYLATDNSETQKWFRDKLTDKLITFADIHNGQELYKGVYEPSKVERFTTSLHTVVDFLILKNSKVFLGSSESSFSLLIHQWRQNKEDFHIFGRL